MADQDIRKKRASIQRQARQAAAICLGYRVRALSRRITAVYDEAFRPLGIKGSQMNVLTVIAASGDKSRASQLAERIALEPSSMSRIIEVMRRNGWVDTQFDPDDERARIVSLTPAGIALYAEAMPLWKEAQAEVRRIMGEEGAETFIELANTSLAEAAS